MAWDNMYIKTSRIEDTANGNVYLSIPEKGKEGYLIEFPLRLVRPTRRKTIKKLSYGKDFTFRMYDDEERYTNISRAQFEKLFAGEHVKLVESLAR